MNNQPERINILGVEVDPLPIQTAIDRIIARTQSPGSCYIVKPYVEFLNGEHNQVLNQAWLVLPDGVALQWAAYFQSTRGTLGAWLGSIAAILIRPRRLGSVIPERFGGTNFTWPLLEQAAEAGTTIYLIGSPKNHSIEHTATWLQSHLPHIHIVGTCEGRDSSGVFSQDLENTLLRDLQQTQPQLILTGIGFPQQEYLNQRLAQQLTQGVLIGEGGTFDYQQFGGQQRKAPGWLQTIGLEWFWRLLLEPKRWRRQLAIPRFMWRVYKDLQTRMQ